MLLLRRLVRLAWDRMAAVALILLSGVALLLGWVGVSGADLPSKQLPYLISGGIGGVYLLGLGALLWLSGDLRDEWTRLGRIHEVLGGLTATGVVDAGALEADEATPGQADLTEPAAKADRADRRRRSVTAGT